MGHDDEHNLDYLLTKADKNNYFKGMYAHEYVNILFLSDIPYGLFDDEVIIYANHFLNLKKRSGYDNEICFIMGCKKIARESLKEGIADSILYSENTYCTGGPHTLNYDKTKNFGIDFSATSTWNPSILENGLDVLVIYSRTKNGLFSILENLYEGKFELNIM